MLELSLHDKNFKIITVLPVKKCTLKPPYFSAFCYNQRFSPKELHPERKKKLHAIFFRKRFGENTIRNESQAFT